MEISCKMFQSTNLVVESSCKNCPESNTRLVALVFSCLRFQITMSWFLCHVFSLLILLSFSQRVDSCYWRLLLMVRCLLALSKFHWFSILFEIIGKIHGISTIVSLSHKPYRFVLLQHLHYQAQNDRSRRSRIDSCDKCSWKEKGSFSGILSFLPHGWYSHAMKILSIIILVLK